ncbi:hypothetical protein HDU98_008078 [Podochytrium sp. JEL0797]|nr:hypothetical protein HDU98_008078 [Podochytrium sp. JEL0797]
MDCYGSDRLHASSDHLLSAENDAGTSADLSILTAFGMAPPEHAIDSCETLIFAPPEFPQSQEDIKYEDEYSNVGYLDDDVHQTGCDDGRDAIDAHLNPQPGQEDRSSSSSTSYLSAAIRQIQTALRSYACTQCPLTFYQKIELKNHEREHNGQPLIKTFPCRYCDLLFERSATAKVHERKHTGERPHVCSHCTYASGQISNLKRHMAVAHNVEYVTKYQDLERPFLCSRCPKKYGSRVALSHHMKEQHPHLPATVVRRAIAERRVFCGYCHKGYVDRTTYKRHLEINHPEVSVPKTPRKPKDKKCKQCSFRYASPEVIKLHMQRVHGNGEQPFWCNGCSHSFSSQINLNAHLRRQTCVSLSELDIGDNPTSLWIQCEECDTWREIFSLFRLTKAPLKLVEELVKDIHYKCGGSIFPIGCDTQIHSDLFDEDGKPLVFTRAGLTCESAGPSGDWDAAGEEEAEVKQEYEDEDVKEEYDDADVKEES